MLSTAQAATFIVETDGDQKDKTPGDGLCYTVNQVCTLRAAIEEANMFPGDDTIEFTASFHAPNAPRTIFLSLGELHVFGNMSSKANLTIKGPGARQLMVDGGHQSRVFVVSSYVDNFTMSGLTVQNGYFAQSQFSFDGGAGICNFFSTMNLSGIAVRNNSTASDQNQRDGELGGGIFNYQGVLNLKDSTISGNKSPRGGGIEDAGGTVNIFNSTITNNVSTNFGGGGIAAWGTLTIRNSTITNNSGMNPLNTAPTYKNAGGVFHDEVSPNPAYIGNTIIANNTAPGNKDIAGNIISLGNNLVKSRGTSTGYVASDLPNGTDPKLGSLKNNGGQTDTRNLLDGSPAIDAGNDCIVLGEPCISIGFQYDQRGFGYKRKYGSAVDIGAIEHQPVRINPYPVVIGGKLFQPDGRGQSRALITLIERDGTTLSVETDEQGRFKFDGIETGKAYVIRVESPEYSYEPRTIVVTQERDDVNFVPAEDSSENTQERK